jgi:hypothetical protein
MADISRAPALPVVERTYELWHHEPRYGVHGVELTPESWTVYSQIETNFSR